LALNGLDLALSENELASLGGRSLLPKHEGGNSGGVTVVVILANRGAAGRLPFPDVLALVELDTASASHG